jgi:Tfp pilus assembly protein PilX
MAKQLRRPRQYQFRDRGFSLLATILVGLLMLLLALTLIARTQSDQMIVSSQKLTMGSLSLADAALVTHWKDIFTEDPSQRQLWLVDYCYPSDDTSDPSKANAAPSTPALGSGGGLLKESFIKFS